MKILRVSGKNITTFDHFELDFSVEPLRSCGLFAITGPTGAGKSSLLDAICLSLYGRTPRYSNHGGIKIGRPDDQEKGRLLANDPRALMSYGSGFIETEVDFTRDHKKFYRARWYVQRSRKKPEGSFQGVTQELYEILEHADAQKGQEAKLKLIEGTKVTDVRRCIEQHVGLKYEEFCRTVFLAQGEFDAFLKREDERSRLLELITGDQLYSRISEIAQDRLKNAEARLSQMRSDVEEDLLDDEDFSLINEELDRCVNILKEARVTQRDAQRAEFTVAQLQDSFRKYKEVNELIERQLEAQTQTDGQLTEEIEKLFNFKDLLNSGARRFNLESTLSSMDLSREQLIEEERLQSISEAELKTAQTELEQELQRRAGEQAQYLMKTAELKHSEERIKHAEERNQQLTSEIESIDKFRSQRQGEIEELESAINELRLKSDRHISRLATQQDYQRLVHHQERWGSIFRSIHETSTWSRTKKQKINEQRSQYRSITESLKSLDQEWSSAERRCKSIRHRVTHLEQSLSEEELYRKRENLQRLEKGILNAKTAHTLLSTLKDQLNRLVKIKALSTEHQEVLSRSKSEYTELLVKLRMNEALLNELESALQRDEAESYLVPLREALEEGSPCPLCGAVKHDLERFEQERLASSSSYERIKILKQEGVELITNRDQVQRQMTQAEQALILVNEQRTAELIRCEEVLQTWRVLCADEGWRDEVNSHPKINEYTRLLISDLWPDEKVLNEELYTDLTKALLEIEGRSNEELRSLNQSIAGMVHEQRTLQSLREELDREVLSIQDFEERKFSLEQDLQAVHDVSRALERDLEELELELQTHLSELEEFAPEEIESTETHELLALQERWTALCHEWREELRLQEARVENVEAKTQTLSLKQDELKRALEKRATLIPLREEQMIELQNERRAYAKLNDQLAESVEDERARQALFTEREKQQEKLDLLTQERAARQLKLGGVEAQIEALKRDLKLELARYNDLKSRSSLVEDEIVSYLSIWQGLDLKALDQERDRRSQERAALEDLSQQRSIIEDQVLEHYHALPSHYRSSLDEVLSQSLVDSDSEKVQKLIQRTVTSVRHTLTEIASVIETNLLKEAQTRQTLDRHHQALSKQDNESPEVREAIAETQRLRVMVKTLGGGGKHGGFNAYAQRFTLEMIIEHANHYLERLMSRYQLEMIDDDKKPLNFQVIDKDLGDEVRSVNSLSGGESFLISLALALGLSSTSSQNTHIESLFIDEGFGTLDPQSLDMAISMLDHLQVQGIQIGIISHVDGIAERVGTQVQVKKTSAGKSKVYISQRFDKLLEEASTQYASI